MVCVKDERRGNYIWLYSNRPFWPLDPRPEDFKLLDIAHGSALENRWHGQTKIPVNVAYHANNVRKLAIVLAPEGRRALTGLYAQLHDAHEGLLKDIAKPLKEMFPDWGEMERNVDIAIYKHFGLDPDIPKDIQQVIALCDRWAAGLEAKAYHCLKNSELRSLGTPPPEIRLAAGLLDRSIDYSRDKNEFISGTRILLQTLGLPYLEV